MMNEGKQTGLGTEPGRVLPPKRRQGRPRKNHAITPREKGFMLQKVDGRMKKPRRKKNDILCPAAADGDFIGQQVHGVLDGSFDAGYLLTVRVGGSQIVLRGVVFEPSLSMPISKANDIAPHVKFTRRDEFVTPLAIQHPTLKPVLQVAASAGHIQATATTSASAPALPNVHTTVVVEQNTPLRGANMDDSEQVALEGLQPQNTAQVLHLPRNTVSAFAQDKSGPTFEETTSLQYAPHLEESDQHKDNHLYRNEWSKEA